MALSGSPAVASIRNLSPFELAAQEMAVQIYQHFGYKTISPGSPIPSDLLKIELAKQNSAQLRRLHFVASLLGDTQRLADAGGIYQSQDGGLTLTQFDGSFGIDLQGQVDSQARNFLAGTSIYAIYHSDRKWLPKGHPWLRVSREDALAVIELLNGLTDDAISAIVDLASVSEMDRSHLKKALRTRRDIMKNDLIKLFPNVSPSMSARDLMNQILIGHEAGASEKQRTLTYLLHGNFGDIKAKLRKASAERTATARDLPTESAKFKGLSDQQLKEQWNGRLTLDLPATDELQYLGKVKGLKRGDKVTVTRMVSLSSEDLVELLQTRLFSSHLLYLFNFDLKFLNSLYEEIGLRGVDQKLQAAIQSGGDVAIPTTYATDGYGSTRLDKPLIYNLKTRRFDVQVSFRVPVEAIVVGMDHVPRHVANNPLGFGFIGTDATEESEITFIDAMIPEWIATDWQQLSDIFNSGTFPREIVNSNPDTY